MNYKTLKALRGSIKKWEGIVAGTKEDQGPSNCPLCTMFYWQDNDCQGCPVMERTGKPYCAGTPHLLWERSFKLSQPMKPYNDRTFRLAKKELAFLKTLLPKGKK